MRRQLDPAARRRPLSVVARVAFGLVAAGVAGDHDADRVGRVEHPNPTFRIVAGCEFRRQEAFRDVLADAEARQAHVIRVALRVFGCDRHVLVQKLPEAFHRNGRMVLVAGLPFEGRFQLFELGMKQIEIFDLDGILALVEAEIDPEQALNAAIARRYERRNDPSFAGTPAIGSRRESA